MVLAALLLAGCCQEHREVQDDVGRFVAKAEGERQRLQIDLERFAVANRLIATRLPFDKERFLEWRKREWWRLTHRFSWLITYAWEDVTRLSLEMGRFYGYEIRNFPVLQADIRRFFLQADPAWRNLVMDVCAFVEWQRREAYPLADEVSAFFAAAPFEWAKLELEIQQALEFRQREYRLFAANGREFFRHSLVEWERLQAGWWRWRAHAAIEQQRLAVDFALFLDAEWAQVPRLVDEWTMWGAHAAAERHAFLADLRALQVNVRLDADLLIQDLARFHANHLSGIPALMLEIDDFFRIYEREWGPLRAEVKRFWRAEIANRHLAMDDLRRFYTRSREEAAELEAGMVRFATYSRKEWDDLVATVRRFATCERQVAYGDGVVPTMGLDGPLHSGSHMPPQTIQHAP
jgi:hypothetical protein